LHSLQCTPLTSPWRAANGVIEPARQFDLGSYWPSHSLFSASPIIH
jgi:hypothetical protein